MQRIGLWQVTEEGPRKLESGAVDLEENLEAWIERDPGMLQHGLTVVGRQIQVAGDRRCCPLPPADRNRHVAPDRINSEKESQMTTHFVTYRPSRDKSKPDVLDRYDDFLSWKPEGRIETWSARKTFQPGDLAIFYMSSPLMSIVGLGLVDSEPYYEEIDNPADFNNPVFCDFRPAWFLDNLVPIKEAIGRQGLEAWWKTCPYQSIRRMDPSVAQALMQEVLDRNRHLGTELEGLGWDATSPLDFSAVYPKQAAVSQRQHGRWLLKDLLNLNWRQFEQLVAEMFRHKNRGAEVEPTGRGPDKGVDIIITAGGWLPGRAIAQCKRYQPNVKVSSQDVQRFVGAMTKSKARKGYFITTSSFTRYAVGFASGLNVELIDGPGLVKMISQIKDFPSPTEFISSAAG